jgi:hypothetical protein
MMSTNPIIPGAPGHFVNEGAIQASLFRASSIATDLELANYGFRPIPVDPPHIHLDPDGNSIAIYHDACGAVIRRWASAQGVGDSIPRPVHGASFSHRNFGRGLRCTTSLNGRVNERFNARCHATDHSATIADHRLSAGACCVLATLGGESLRSTARLRLSPLAVRCLRNRQLDPVVDVSKDRFAVTARIALYPLPCRCCQFEWHLGLGICKGGKQLSDRLISLSSTDFRAKRCTIGGLQESGCGVE